MVLATFAVQSAARPVPAVVALQEHAPSRNAGTFASALQMPSVPPVRADESVEVDVEVDVEALDGGGELTLLVVVEVVVVEVVVVEVVVGGGEGGLPSVHPIPYEGLQTLFGQEYL